MKQHLIHYGCHTPISYTAYTHSHKSFFQWTSLSQICLDDSALLVQIWEKLDYFLSQCLLYMRVQNFRVLNFIKCLIKNSICYWFLELSDGSMASVCTFTITIFIPKHSTSSITTVNFDFGCSVLARWYEHLRKLTIFSSSLS